MEREILFKAKDKDDGKWYEGYYMCLHDTTYCCMPSDSLEEAKRMEKENTHHYIVFERMTDWGLPNRHLKAEILPETLCQYTGLTDKNGKKIWENDIVTEDFGNFKGTVRFGEFESQILKNIGFNIDWISNISYRQDICWWARKCEVIGNIFDNLELLEKQNE